MWGSRAVWERRQSCCCFGAGSLITSISPWMSPLLPHSIANKNKPTFPFTVRHTSKIQYFILPVTFSLHGPQQELRVRSSQRCIFHPGISCWAKWILQTPEEPEVIPMDVFQASWLHWFILGLLHTLQWIRDKAWIKSSIIPVPPRDLGCPDLPTLTDTLCWRSSPRWPHHTDFKPTDLWGQQVWDWLIWCGFKWWMQPGNQGGGEIRAKSAAWLSAAFAGVWWMLYLYRSMIHGTGEQIHYKPCMILTVTLHSFGSSFFFMNILDHPDHTRSVTTTQQLDFWAGQNPQASALDSISWGAVNHLNCSCLPE